MYAIGIDSDFLKHLLLYLCEGLGGLNANNDRISDTKENRHADLSFAHQRHHLVLGRQVLHTMLKIWLDEL